MSCWKDNSHNSLVNYHWMMLNDVINTVSATIEQRKKNIFKSFLKSSMNSVRHTTSLSIIKFYATILLFMGSKKYNIRVNYIHESIKRITCNHLFKTMMMMMHMSLWLKLIFFPSIFIFFSAISLVSHQNALCFFLFHINVKEEMQFFNQNEWNYFFFPGCGNENKFFC